MPEIVNYQSVQFYFIHQIQLETMIPIENAVV